MPAEGTSATVQYFYDQLGRVTTALYDNGVCVAYSYDANGNRTAQSNTAGNGVPPMTWGAGVWGCVPWTPS
ncbi:RHS repeat protein [Burkholderia ambifaria]|nr:RHS repeat protein [Burkholderia ambifaria]